MAHDVFICHSAKDKTTADAVCAMLESNGVRCWIAPRDVTAGMEWSECIIDAIEECRIMVLVFTTHANESPQIRREVERAVKRGVAILPMRIDDILPGRALEYFIGNVHWLDALTPPLETHLKNLSETVKMLLGRMPAREIPPHVLPIEPPYPRPLSARPKFESAGAAVPQNAVSNAGERVQEVSPKRTEIASPPVSGTPPASRVVVVATKTRWPPIGVIVVVTLGFIAAGGLLVGVSSDIIGGHFQSFEFLFFLFAAADIAAGYGLLKLKRWGRILKIVHSVVSVCVLISIVQNPYREGSASLALWVVLVAYLVAVVLYMFNTRVNQAFSKAG